jgi:hypothetical protein
MSTQNLSPGYFANETKQLLLIHLLKIRLMTAAEFKLVKKTTFTTTTTKSENFAQKKNNFVFAVSSI